MPKIRIVSTPPGFARGGIRAQWVGVEIPIVEGREKKKAEKGMPTTGPSVGGYVVRGEDAVEALRNAGKTEAAAFWSNPIPPSHMRFARDCCELVA